MAMAQRLALAIIGRPAFERVSWLTIRIEAAHSPTVPCSIATEVTMPGRAGPGPEARARQDAP